MIRGMVQKWNLVSDKAEDILLQQWNLGDSRVYDPERDFLFFEHIMKTGGTTLSMILELLFPDAVFPGSDASAIFHFEEARKILNSSAEEFYRVGYAHATVRNEAVEKSTRLRNLLREHLGSNRRIRILSMVREPVALRASLIGMSQCQYNAWIKSYNTEHGLDKHNCNISLAQMVQRRRDSYINTLCPSMKKFYFDNNITPKLQAPLSTTCLQLEQGNDPFKLCRSIRALLDSSLYNTTFHNMLKPVMGRYISGTGVNQDRTIMTPKDVEEYTLQDLGAIIHSHTFASDSGDQEPDILWFGITERMEESLCLLFHTLRIPTPDLSSGKNKSINHRVVPCRPTNWWTTDEKEEVVSREPWDFAVYRTANAILDLRLQKMRQQILSSQNRDDSTTISFFQNQYEIKLPSFVSPQCWELISHVAQR
eukprot:CAMPEP_0194225690 /NCGR_PEP_ID=MMETSP0156-20130528/40128_1 /TAXON_ID=33649 /ORGANISM="Thalassionema nitzschioides, Strain L26-B" /LENGTH=423 /DNA_ID=CAMNT_0038957737 /DNA_START=278 /DNA_END=1549 /DNA_ORIENTATION=+